MTRARRRRRRVFVALAAVILAVTLGRHAGTALVVRTPLDTPDAIFVLGSHEWERLPAAADLARRYPAARVWLSMPRVPSIYNCHDCNGRVDRLVAFGVARERIGFLAMRVSNTRDEAEAAKYQCHDANVRRLVIVTSPYHTRRAWGTFQEVFAGANVALGIEPAAPAQARPESWWASPYDRSYVRYEWAALAYHAVWP